jgi:hypothetical protein
MLKNHFERCHPAAFICHPDPASPACPAYRRQAQAGREKDLKASSWE